MHDSYHVIPSSDHVIPNSYHVIPDTGTYKILLKIESQVIINLIGYIHRLSYKYSQSKHTSAVVRIRL